MVYVKWQAQGLENNKCLVYVSSHCLPTWPKWWQCLPFMRWTLCSVCLGFSRFYCYKSLVLESASARGKPEMAGCPTFTTSRWYTCPNLSSRTCQSSGKAGKPPVGTCAGIPGWIRMLRGGVTIICAYIWTVSPGTGQVKAIKNKTRSLPHKGAVGRHVCTRGQH